MSNSKKRADKSLKKFNSKKVFKTSTLIGICISKSKTNNFRKGFHPKIDQEAYRDNKLEELFHSVQEFGLMNYINHILRTRCVLT